MWHILHREQYFELPRTFCETLKYFLNPMNIKNGKDIF
jgi:hypothetical protein